MVAAWLVAVQALYVAGAASFGCTSAEQTARLQSLRGAGGFDQQLYQQVFQGECVPIDKGKLIEADVEAGNASLLRVDRRLLPPGYLAPRGDFRLVRPAAPASRSK